MSTYLETIVNGITSTPINVRTLDSDGNEWVAGKITVGAITPTQDGDLATKKYVDENGGASYDIATTTTAGLMSAADKVALETLKANEAAHLNVKNQEQIILHDAQNEDVIHCKVKVEPQRGPITIGKNKFNPDTEIREYYLTSGGVPTYSPDDAYTDLIPVTSGSKVTISGKLTLIGSNGKQTNRRIHGYNSSGTWVSQVGVKTITAADAKAATEPLPWNITVTVPSGVSYLRVSHRQDEAEMMVEYGDSKTNYEPYQEISTLLKNSDVEVEITDGTYTDTYAVDITPTIWCGTVDFINGEVTENYSEIASYNGETLPGYWYSDRDTYAVGVTPTTGAQVVYEITTPITYSITPTAMTTYEGYNLITTDGVLFTYFEYYSTASLVSVINDVQNLQDEVDDKEDAITAVGILKRDSEGVITGATLGVDYGTYSKPNGGIPETDLSTEVQYKLNNGSGGSGGSLTNALKQALLNIAQHIAYTDSNGMVYYNALYDALYNAELDSITAFYSTGGTPIMEGATLNDLKPYLVVTANYADGSSAVVTNYTLSGNLNVGNNTITVTFEEETTTFTATITSILPSGYTRLTYVQSNGNSYAQTTLASADVLHGEYEFMVTDAAAQNGNHHFFSSTNTFMPFFKTSGGNPRISAKLKGNDVITSGSNLYDWQLNTRYKWEAYPDLIINDTYIMTNGEGSTANSTDYFCLFNYGSPSNSTNFYGRLYYIKVYGNNGELVFNGIPAKDGNNVPGVYDSVSSTFYTSATANPFIAGEEVV